MSPSNLTLLTHSHNAIAAKKRKKQSQIKEIVFDDQARHEFLTGFHKRKLAKAEAARKKAQDKEKRDHLEFRREQRRMLRERAIQNAAHVEQAYGALVDNDEEWAGIDDRPAGKQSQPEQEEEYEDEEHLATVTVVEDFDPDTLIHGPPRTSQPAPRNPTLRNHDRPTSLSQKASAKTDTLRKPKSKLKANKVHYETKDARKLERTKQHARRTEKASLAGGKTKTRTNAKGSRRNAKAGGKGRR